MTKVLVIGGTGFIGTRVQRDLTGAGYDVVCTAWTDEGMARLAERGVPGVRVDIRHPETVTEAASDADAVINLAFAADDPAAAEIGLAVALTTALGGTGKTLVWTSGVGVAGASSERDTDEEAPLIVDGPVGWRAQAEAIVLAAAEQGIRTVVIRPSIVHADGEAAILGLLAYASQGRDAVPYPDAGDAEWSTVHVDDLADLYLRALQSAESGTVYIAASDHYVKIKQVAEYLSTKLGMDGRTVSLSVEELRGVIGPMADLVATPAAFSSARARRDLGWKPSAPALI